MSVRKEKERKGKERKGKKRKGNERKEKKMTAAVHKKGTDVPSVPFFLYFGEILLEEFVHLVTFNKLLVETICTGLG